MLTHQYDLIEVADVTSVLGEGRGNWKETYVTRYSKRYLKSLPLVSDLQTLEANK